MCPKTHEESGSRSRFLTDLSRVITGLFLCIVNFSLKLVASYFPFVYLLIKLLLFLFKIGSVGLCLLREREHGP